LILQTIAAAQPNPRSITSHPLPNYGSYAIDSAGNAYGVTAFGPVTPGAAQTQSGGGTCVFGTSPSSGKPPFGPCADVNIAKTDRSGNTIFGTLLGGPDNDIGTAVAIDNVGNVYVAGYTGPSFPTTPGAAIPAYPANSGSVAAFAAKLNADGSQFLYSTYLPAAMRFPTAIAVDPQGNIYVAGKTLDDHACVVQVSADGSSIGYTKIFAGRGSENATAIAVDAAGNAFVTGYTGSSDFPATLGVVQRTLAGTGNAFVTKLSPSGAIVFSTFLGGSAIDQGNAIVLDAAGNLYIGGAAQSLDFPTTPETFQSQPLVPAWSFWPGGFITKLSPDASTILYSSYVMSAGPETIGLPPPPYIIAAGVSGIALGPAGDAYLTGNTQSLFPVTNSAPQPCFGGISDSFVAHVDSNGALLDSTYVGGPFEDSPMAIGLASDGSVLLASVSALKASLAQIRFGDPGSAPAPCVSPAIANSATLYDTGAIAPGQFTTITGFGIGPEIGVSSTPDAQGPAPTALAGVEVIINGVAVPIYYAQSRQVNFLAPFELSGQTSAGISLRYNNTIFGFVTKSISYANPGLFRLEPNASAQAFAVNDDGTLNGAANPAAAGSYIALLGTGFGSTSPACPTGGMNVPFAASLTPNAVTRIVTGLPNFQHDTQVTYAGSAPERACGIEQINIQIPTDAKPGPLIVEPIQQLPPPAVAVFPVGGFAGAVVYVK
jgi:uncharacterized protein (TIGR03437 family)